MLITNALVPFGEGFQTATMQIEAGRITALEPGSTALAPALDWQGDYLLPGLVEIHTDNLENHFVPRPKVIWPNGLAACLAHDAQMAAAGVTTVFDAITMGSYDGEKTPRQLILDDMLAAIDQARRAGVLRIDHRLHFRCELSAKELLPALEPHRDAAGLGLVSIMDHTPGQRQWRDLEKLYDFAERNGKPRAEIVADVERRIACGRANAEANRGGRSWPCLPIGACRWRATTIRPRRISTRLWPTVSASRSFLVLWRRLGWPKSAAFGPSAARPISCAMVRIPATSR